jgi:hypothetical protein
MIAFLLNPTIGSGGIALMLTIAEGIALTAILAVLAERYLFPMSRDRYPRQGAGAPHA